MQQLFQYAANNFWLVAAAALMMLLVAAYEFRARTAASGSIGPGEAVRLMNSGAVLVDVRGREAYEAGHISGARHVPGENIADGAQSLERFKDKPIIVYCERGTTAGAATRHLGRLGFRHTYNLRGGLAAWRQENMPVVRE
jgi:rhodanese-related sulfurtransferase